MDGITLLPPLCGKCSQRASPIQNSNIVLFGNTPYLILQRHLQVSATTIYDKTLHFKAEETLINVFFFHSYALGICLE